MKVYYAHTESLFGSETESQDQNTLGHFGMNIVDPSWPDIQVKVKMMREDGMTEDEIQGFLNRYIDECDALVYRGNKDGSVPDDVQRAIDRIVDTNKPVLQLPAFTEAVESDTE